MKILVIDGQGGKLGAQIISLIKSKNNSNLEIIGVGTNAMASEAFLKAKADVVATGENPVIVCARDADVIIGPIGIVIADSLYGEITPAMALSVSQSKATKLLIPINKCNNIIVGITDNSMKNIFDQISDYIDKLVK
jgi:hypothetical protein